MSSCTRHYLFIYIYFFCFPKPLASKAEDLRPTGEHLTCGEIKTFNTANPPCFSAPGATNTLTLIKITSDKIRIKMMETASVWRWCVVKLLPTSRVFAEPRSRDEADLDVNSCCFLWLLSRHDSSFRNEGDSKSHVVPVTFPWRIWNFGLFIRDSLDVQRPWQV